MVTCLEGWHGVEYVCCLCCWYQWLCKLFLLLFLLRLLTLPLLRSHHLRMSASASGASLDVLLSVIEGRLRVRVLFLGLGGLYKHLGCEGAFAGNVCCSIWTGWPGGEVVWCRSGGFCSLGAVSRKVMALVGLGVVYELWEWFAGGVLEGEGLLGKDGDGDGEGCV